MKNFIQQISIECLLYAKHITTEGTAGIHGVNYPMSSLTYQRWSLYFPQPHQTGVLGQTEVLNFINSRLEMEGLSERGEAHFNSTLIFEDFLDSL